MTAILTARLKRAAAFVAIVWGVAASYVAFEVVALRSTSLALSHPDIFGDRLLPSVVTESDSCPALPGSSDAEPGPPSARAGAFALGVAAGREAVFRQWARSNPQAVEPLRVTVEKAAASLEIPPPGSFVPLRLADANSEFVNWVETDQRGTARQLAGRYGPQTCHAYKLGAVWGYSEVIRMALPTHRAAFAVEIRYYAQRIPIPDELWQPLLEPSAFPAGSAELEDEMSAASARIIGYLADRRHSP